MPLAEVLEAALVFTGWLVLRLGLALLAIAVLAIPAYLIVAALKGFDALRRVPGLERIEGLLFSPALYYAPGHTWLVRSGRGLRVGLDDVAQRLLQGLTAVTLPVPGARVRSGSVVSVAACGGKRAEVVAPVNGVVTAVNAKLGRDPAAVHRDPYAAGWLFEIEPADIGFKTLRRGKEARSWLLGESARLTRSLEERLGVAAADGGKLLRSPAELLDDEEWAELADDFLGGARAER